MDAQLVLQRDGAYVVQLCGLAVGAHQPFGHDEKRDALRAGWASGDPRQYGVNDVVRHVVVAPGDEDLGPPDQIGTVRPGDGLGVQSADVGTRMGLGQVHGSRPLAGDQFLQIRLLLFG